MPIRLRSRRSCGSCSTSGATGRRAGSTSCSTWRASPSSTTSTFSTGWTFATDLAGGRGDFPNVEAAEKPSRASAPSPNARPRTCRAPRADPGDQWVILSGCGRGNEGEEAGSRGGAEARRFMVRGQPARTALGARKAEPSRWRLPLRARRDILRVSAPPREPRLLLSLAASEPQRAHPPRLRTQTNIRSLSSSPQQAGIQRQCGISMLSCECSPERTGPSTPAPRLVLDPACAGMTRSLNESQPRLRTHILPSSPALSQAPLACRRKKKRDPGTRRG